MEPKSALNNVMSQMSQGGQGALPPKQPGDMTDPLLTAMKALQTFNKSIMERDPKDPTLKLVRQIMMELARLTHMDQSEKMQQGNPMQAPMGADMGMPMDMSGGDQQGGAPQMPDLSQFSKLS